MVTMPANDDRMAFAEGEWEARVKLAAVYRIFARMGWDDLIYTHISARVPGPAHHFLINPFGLMYEEVTAANLVKIDIDGNPVSETNYPVNYAGFVIHGAVHRAIPDAHCVIHLHTRDGVAVSCQKDGLLPLSQQALVYFGDLAYHDYEGLALDLSEQERLVDHVGDARMVILRNHGTLTIGSTIDEAFWRMYVLEQACAIQVAAQAAGPDGLLLPDAGVRAKTMTQKPEGTRIGGGIGQMELAAWMRKLDRDGADYRA